MEQLYRLYFRDVYLYPRSLCGSEQLAEELTAETFSQALAGLHRFRGDCDVRVWLCQIAKYQYYTHCRKQKRQPQPLPEHLPDSRCSLEQALEDKDAAARIHQYLHQMRQPYQEVFMLRVFCELPFAQIAALFGKTESWARVTYYRAKREIQQWMEGMEG